MDSGNRIGIGFGQSADERKLRNKGGYRSSRNKERGNKGGRSTTKEWQITFTMSQIRLLCKDSNSADNLAGKGKLVYPKGYIRDANTVDQKNLTDKIILSKTDFLTAAKRLDLLFYIPVDTVPVMLEFKQNSADGVKLGNKIPPPL